ncbi:translation initiation factor eIF-1A [Halobaculum marinum]|uniref:Translation initiation factor 1A n=1 Tax=Halobaculum marinum TaxID=3031996 RepID=A0ABD5WVE4_9EURY|nr:translation initiation factor eIF-1A [Halobaculum sp. DT55]
MSDDSPNRKPLRMPDDNQVFATVTEMLGGRRVTLRCADGEERMGRIPGRMRFRTWVKEGDIVIAEPWDWQDEKAEVVWRYESDDAQQLREEGHIQ